MNETIRVVFWTLTAVAVVILVLRMRKAGYFGKEPPQTIETKKAE